MNPGRDLDPYLQDHILFSTLTTNELKLSHHSTTTLTFPVADPGFSPGGAPTPKIAIIFHIFAENCMKMKEFGPPGGGARPWRPPWIRQWYCGAVFPQKIQRFTF